MAVLSVDIDAHTGESTTTKALQVAVVPHPLEVRTCAIKKRRGRKGGGAKFLWYMAQTMTVGLKPVSLPEGIGIYRRLARV